MRRFVLGCVIAGLAVQPALAQNTADNNARWWVQPGQVDTLRVFNPLTTGYGRIGLLYSFNQQLLAAQGIFTNQPIAANDQFGAVLGLGTRLMPILRAELQAGGIFNVRTRTPANPTGSFGRMRSAQILTNIYLDGAPLLGNAWGLNPYAFAGAGISFNTWSFGDVANGADGEHTRASFAWNAGLGLQYQLMDSLILDLAYRYIDIGRFTSNPRAVVSVPPVRTNGFTAHQVMFTVVVPFAGLAR